MKKFNIHQLKTFLKVSNNYDQKVFKALTIIILKILKIKFQINQITSEFQVFLLNSIILEAFK